MIMNAQSKIKQEEEKEKILNNNIKKIKTDC